MVCSKCGAVLNPGQKFCSKCGNRVESQPTAPVQQPSSPGQLAAHQQARQTAQPAPAHPSSYDPSFNFDKLLVNQKKFSLDTAYYVYDEQGNERFHVGRNLFQLKVRFKVYSDSGKQNVLLNVTPNSIFDSLLSRYVVYGADSMPIAHLRRRHIMSILRRTWNIFDSGGSLIGFASEDSWFKAFIRRFMPGGEFLKTDFIFTIGGRQVGKFVRKWTLFDKYVLDLTEDTQRLLDRRIALAMCILLDLGEGR